MKKILFILLLILTLPVYAQYVGIKPLKGIQLDYSNPLTKGLAGYWLMNEGGGNTVYDISGNGHHGTITGATWTGGKFGSALSFDGSNNVDTGWDAGKDLSAFSVVAWVYPQASSDGDYYIVDQSAGSYSLALRHDKDNNQVEAFCFSGAGTLHGVLMTGSSTFMANTWYHVAYTYNASGSVLYLNAVSKDTGDGADNLRDGTETLHIGSEYDDSDAFIGLIDNVEIFDRALSASEVQSLHTAPFQMFERDESYMYVSAGEAPTTVPQFIRIQLGKIPAWFIVLVLISTIATAIGVNKRRRDDKDKLKWMD